MGPSGSGKTSLLNVLANRVPFSKKATLSGEILVGNRPHTNVRSAYVMQEEALFELATVRETLMFTAQLRLPEGTTSSEQRQRVQEVITELNLSKCADTIIGNVKIRGVSGGERRRLAIGIELLNDPPLVFMDEPTSGLDSFQAAAVMETLSTLAKRGRTVVASIHQPRSSIYAMLDKILLMASGKVVYFGAAGTEIENYFASVDLPVPHAFNPADHIVDAISFDSRNEESADVTTKRIEFLLREWDKMANKDTRAVSASVDDGAQVSKSACSATRRNLVAFRLLMHRTWQENTRDKATLFFKQFMNIFFAALFGLVYFQLDRSQTSIQNRNGVLFFTAMNQAFGSVIGTAEMIPRQLIIVSRERAAGMYDVAPYYWSTWAVALPLESIPQLLYVCIQYFLMGLRSGADHFFIFAGILMLESQCAIALGMLISALIKDVTAAAQVAPAVVIIFLMFSGFLLNEDSVPDWLIWLQYLSFIRYSYQALTVNEFRGATFTCEDTDGRNATFCLSGDDWLKSLNFHEVSIGANVGYIIALTVGFNALAYFSVMELRKPKFLKVAKAKKEDLPDAVVISKA